jgi:adenylate cyclase
MNQLVATLSAWLLDPATGQLEPDRLLDGLVQRLASLDLHRIGFWIPTKHPELWGNQLIWEAESGARVIRRGHAVVDSDAFLGSPSEELHRSHATTLRCRLDREPDRSRFQMLRAQAEAGATDYLLLTLEPGVPHGPWVSFTTRRPGGYEASHLELLRALTPLLGLHARLAGAQLATRSLLEVYLGRNAALRVLAGEFRRGTGSELEAALFFCDMRGFTELSDRLPARAVVGVLDRYFEHVAGPIEEQGGEILKFIGDATLAVFPIEGEGTDACRRALAAARAVQSNMRSFSDREAGRVQLGIALHAGRVLYGNIGGRERLDFTVIGASVNEVCRVEAMCKPLQEPLLMTRAFADGVGDADLVSLGHHALKGVAQPAELLTIRA